MRIQEYIRFFTIINFSLICKLCAFFTWWYLAPSYESIILVKYFSYFDFKFCIKIFHKMSNINPAVLHSITIINTYSSQDTATIIFIFLDTGSCLKKECYLFLDSSSAVFVLLLIINLSIWFIFNHLDVSFLTKLINFKIENQEKFICF